jgi:Lrp/AsnC family leucine-responsive transcriptional regulator
VQQTGPVDETDRALLQTLRENGRASWAELARQVGLSAPSVQERVRRLEERGVVTGFHAAVDPRSVGLGVSALVGVYSSDNAESDDVARRLREVPEVEDCWFVAGEEEFVIYVRAADTAALEHVIGKVRRLRGVARTRTTVVLSTRWENRPGPLPG